MKHGLAALTFIALSIAACSSTPDNNDGGSDASTDVKADKVTPKDGGGDAAACGSGTTCEVCDGTFQASHMTAPAANAGKCTQNEIAAFVTACGSQETSSSCDDWQNAEVDAGPNCLECVFSSQQSDPKWGVYVCDDQSGACFFNTPGCLDVALATISQEKQAGGNGSCGDLYNDAYMCEAYSCNSCQSQADYDKCLQSADDNECKSYADLAYSTTGKCAAANDPDASATINSCFGLNDTDLATMTTIMCGSGGGDAGDGG